MFCDRSRQTEWRRDRVNLSRKGKRVQARERVAAARASTPVVEARAEAIMDGADCGGKCVPHSL